MKQVVRCRAAQAAAHTKRFALAAAVTVALGVASVALAAGGLVGKYTTTISSPPQVKGKWSLTLVKGGAYTVAVNGDAVARGKYSATATRITFGRESGGSGCTGSGTYSWKKSGKTLRFTRIREAASCQGRAAVLAHRFTQVR